MGKKSQQELDAEQKAAARAAAASRPGVQTVSQEQAARLDERIAAKRDAATPKELEKMEDNLVSKKGVANMGVAKPGAYSGSSPAVATRAELSNLEADVVAKQRARPANDSLDQKVSAKEASSAPGARAALTSLEDEVTAKTGSTSISGQAEISRLDERIAAKNASVAPAGPPPQALLDAEDSVLKKKGASGGQDGPSKEIQTSKESPVEQFPTKNEGGLYPQDSVAQNDLEYGEYGGPDEKGLAVAFAVEDDDEDMFIPSAVEYDPDAKPPIHKNRRFRLYAFLALVVIIVGTIGTGVGMSLSKRETTIPYRETLGIRENIERIIGSDQLEDRNNPYRKALDWITYEDPKQLTPDAATFIQRFIMAYFFFATSVKNPWAGGCNPMPDTDECMLESMVQLDPPIYIQTPWKRWLSKQEECAWAGVYCDKGGNVRSMEFGGMNMTGTFPEGIVHLPFLQSFGIVFSQMEGSLPHNIHELKHLVSIELQGNAFSGSIPEGWYKSRSLQRINLGVNQLTGPLTNDLAKLRDLKGFFVLRNFLSGQLPDALGDLNSVTYMRLNRNLFNGTIPTTIGNLQDTKDLWLQRNQLTGRVPTEIGGMLDLEDFRVYVNKLTGPLPDEIYNCTDVKRFDLYENDFNGTISPSISKFKKLDTLRIQQNRFSGDIPKEMGQLTMLTQLDVSGNDFVGAIPEEVCERRGESMLQELTADCTVPRVGVAEIQCPDKCCSICCDADGGDCLPMDD